MGRRVHVLFLARLDDAIARGELDIEGPSRLPGWTRGHVLTHLARNADGHRRMIEGAGRGEVLEQYEGGAERRSADIGAGAVRPADEIVADLVDATEALEAAWATSDWQGSGRRTLAGESPIARLPFLRTREVALHSVDVDIGVEMDDLDEMYVKLELDRMEMLWTARQPMGLTPLPAGVLALAPTDRLAWFTGRTDVDGLEPAGVF